MGMEVLAYTASPRDTPESRRDDGYIVPGTGDPDGTLPVSWHHGTDRESLRKFLALNLDHIVISLPLTPATTHLLGAEEFSVLSSHSTRTRKPFITNISRGPIIDQAALIHSLQNGELSGAALDVTEPEPLPKDHPLWDAPNIQISPHISALGTEYMFRAADVLKENLRRLERGEPLINEFKRKRGY
jgi:phosphoglycerate dehydrogenase-like enzyme